ncbi:DUF7576 family protein [Haloterrigena alkaliphila]|uniref:Uncharacterized protein n=1 Tax=Haloterrigena alkaliphila TaxID=2816475 RepID=A0A8A2VAL4_9EURY|nr:hypothetical protein [Haloterrigena alkaliphila]QSW99013.1 hypothetical protein J0X25_16765 [Haloterrigena alkaliphila]
MADDGENFWTYCAHCGTQLGIDDWPPIVEMATDGGETDLHSFCDEECRSGWTDTE